LIVITPPHHSTASRTDRPSPSVIARSACLAPPLDVPDRRVKFCHR
jgi:hypothetical protein